MSGFDQPWLASGDARWVLPLLLKATLVLVAAGLVSWSMRRRASAAARHLVWALALSTLLALPFLSVLLPRWDVRVLPPPLAQTAPGLTGLRAPDRPMLAVPSAPAWTPREMPSEAPEFAPPMVTVRPTGQRVASQTFQWDGVGWWTWTVAAWSFGVAFNVLQFVAGTILIALATRRATPVSDGDWERDLAQAAGRLGIRRKVELRRATAVVVPVVWGWRAPVILVPDDSCAWSGERRGALLRHELAHVRRRDWLAQTIAAVVQALYWPHPLVWWAVARLRAEAERACDDCVLSAGTEAPEYAQYLLDAARNLRFAPRFASNTPAVVERTHLGDRLLSLLDDRVIRRPVTRRAVALAASLVVALAAALASLQPAARAAAIKAVKTAIAPVLLSTPTSGTPSTLSATASAKAGPMFTGSVRGPDGKPLANAIVIAWPAKKPFGGAPVVARTDAKGEFRLPVADGAHVLRVESPPLAPRDLERAMPGAAITITLAKGGAIEGSVRDGATRQPIPQARVTTVSFPPIPSEPNAGRITATADKDGRYRLDGLGPGLNWLEATAPGYGRSTIQAKAPASAMHFFLYPGAEIRGSVRDTAGKPVTGVLVSTEIGPGQASSAAPTDGEGRFVVVGLQPGTYKLIARHPQWAPSVQSGVRTEIGSPAQVDFRLEPPASVAGRLVDTDGRPMRGRVLLQAVDGEEIPWQIARDLSCEVGVGGRFILSGVPTGTLTLAIRPLGYPPIQAEVKVARGKLADIGDVTLEMGLVLRGMVRDRMGKPIVGANISARQDDKEAMSLSDPDGSFVVAGLAAGDHKVTVSAEGFAPSQISAQAGGRPLNLVLHAQGIISGAVVDEAGHAVDAYRALARAAGAKEGLTPTSLANEANGHFRIEGVEAGTYVLEIQAASYVDKAVPDVAVTAGRTTDLGRIVLSAGGAIRGTVVDTSGVPVPGVDVRVEDSRGTLRSVRYGGTSEERRATTDIDGRFELRGLPAGPVPLRASHPQFAPTDAEGVAVPVASSPAEARITLFAGGRIEGTARSRGGSPFAGFAIVLPSWVQVPVGDDATFAVDHVAPGRRTLYLMAGSAGLYNAVVSKEVEVRDGETTAIDLSVQDVLVSGRITRGSKPLAQHEIQLLGGNGARMMTGARMVGAAARPSGPERMKAVTDSDGQYQMIVSTPGRYVFSLSSLAAPGAGSGTAGPLQVVVPDADSFRYDVALPDWGLNGRVVEKGTGEPIVEAKVTAILASGEPVGTSARTAADGRFKLAVEPGEYRLRVEAAKHGLVETTLQLGETPIERTFELVQGSVLKGQVVSAGGQGIEYATVAALAADQPAKSNRSLTGGWFEIGGLPTGPHELFAAHELGFAFQASATPGDEPIRLALAPGVRVRLHIKDATGQPVSGTYVRIDLIRWNATSIGVEEWSPYNLWQPTDADGTVRMLLPTGSVQLVAWSFEKKLRGEAHLAVDGSVSEATIALGPPRR
jgi:beta-lactamase regulating signal transducer with metallopeptidase domain